MNSKIAASLLLIGLSTCLAVPAQAADRSSAASRVVKFGDLDLATPAGTRELEARIGKAAIEVCREAVRARQDIFFDACYASVKEAGIAKVMRPVQTAVHNQPSIEK